MKNLSLEPPQAPEHTYSGAEESICQQPSPFRSPCVPRYLLRDNCSLMPADGSHREAAAQAFPMGQSLHPDPFSLSFIVPEERWPHPIPREGMGVLLWCQPVARRMPSSSCCSWECCLPPKKGSLPALSLFPLLWSTFNICCNSIVQLPIGVNRQIAKAHFFFLERQKTNANDIHCGFWYVHLDAYQPNRTSGKQMTWSFSLSYMEFNKKNCETLCVTVKCNLGLHISRNKASSLAKLKKVENCQRKHFCPA